MSARRVVLLSPYALSIFGGVQEQVLVMSRELSRRGHEVLVVCPDQSDHSDYDTPARVVRCGLLASVPANGSRAPVTLSLAASRRAATEIAAFAPDVLHVHEPFAPVLPYSTIRRHATPTVATFHRGGGGPAYSLTRPLLHRLARGLDVTVAVSPAAAATVSEGAGVECTVLFNGFETERFREMPKERGDVPVIFFVGRLEERKGAGTLVDAARLAENAGENWRVVIAGDGPQRSALTQAAVGLTHVEFLGRISDEDKRRWQRRADVCVAPSLRGESFGLVLLEAMASESRVVASDIDGYRDAAGGHAVLAAPGDPTSLYAALREAMSVDEDAVRRAREYAERWSMRVLMDEYENLYDQATLENQRAR